MSKTRSLVVTGMILLISTLVSGCFGGGSDPRFFGSLDGYVYVTTGNAGALGVRTLEEDILDQTSKPLPRAIVSIGGKTGTTDSAGYFLIDSIPVGTYTVSISASGYQTLSIPGIAISKDQTTHLSYRNISFPRKAWNFLVYLDGDNNLEEVAIMDVNEMEQVGSTDQVNILVLIDRALGYDDSNADWTTTRLYYVTKDTNTSTSSVIRSTLLAVLGERDMSDPATLRDFIVYCQEHFPADRTCLTLWNHGGGVYPRSVRPPEKSSTGAKSITALDGGLRGICWDDTSTQPYPWNCLTTDEVARALAEARGQTGQKIDVINMDACLTQMIEVAYELWNRGDSLTDYLVGSEENVPGDGNEYHTVLGHLVANPSMNARSLATTLVNDYYNYYKSTANDTTYSAISLGTEFNTLATAFTGFATAMKNAGDIQGIRRAWFEATGFNAYENKDLYTYADRVGYYTADSAIDNAAADLKMAIENAVIAHKETGLYTISKAYGVSILLPDAEAWAHYSGVNQYSALALSQDTDWDDFIGTFVTLAEN